MQKEDCAYCRRESHVKSLLLYGLEEKNPNFLERQLLTYGVFRFCLLSCTNPEFSEFVVRRIYKNSFQAVEKEHLVYI